MIKREKQNRGSVYKGSDGYWHGQLYFGSNPETGKPIRKRWKRQTRGEVLRAMEDYKNSVAENRRDRLETVLREWLDQVKKPTMKSSSYQRLYSTCERWIIPALGSSGVEWIQAQDIQRLISKMRKEGMSPSSQKKVKDALSDFMDHYIMTHNLMINNPAKYVTIEAQSKQPESDWYMDDDHCLRFLENCRSRSKKDPRGEVLELILQTGLRASEALALTAKDYDPEAKLLMITKTLSTDREIDALSGSKGKINRNIITAPKTRAGARFVPLNGRAAELVTAAIERTPEGRLYPYNVIQLDRYIRRIYKAIGWTGKQGCHTLRHSYVAAMLRCSAGDKSISLATISALVGHRSLAITVDVYGHLTDQIRYSAKTTEPKFNPKYNT